MTERFWLGMIIVFMGGILNGCFSLPMKYARTWAWENMWSVYAVVALLSLPWILAFTMVPHLAQVYSSLGWRAIAYPAIFGLLWGIAQITFGLSIYAIGMAVAFAVTSGLVCLTGALVPILASNPADLLGTAGVTILVGMPVLLAGIALYGKAGTLRSHDQDAAQAKKSPGGMSFKVGLALSIFTGIFGSFWNLGFAFSGNILKRCVELGSSPARATYAVWAVVLTAGLAPNLLYPLFMMSRNKTWGNFRKGNWPRELALSVLMAILWLSAFIVYGVGTTYVGRFGTSLGFTLYIASTILASSSMGIVAGEWKGTSLGTRNMLAGAVATVLASVAILNLGGLFHGFH